MAENETLLDAIRWGNIDIVREQIKAGVDVNKTVPDDNDTPLQLSIKHGQTDIVKALIEAKADVNKTVPGYYYNNYPPLQLSIEHGHTDIAKALIEAKAYVNVENDDNDTPLHLSAKGGHTDIFKVLIEAKADVNVQNKNNDTPLQLSARYGRTDWVKALIEAGADVNKTVSGYYTPLQISARRGHTDIVNALIEAEADVNVKNKNNDTPLHLSAEQGHTDIVNALIEAKADVNVKNKNNDTPLHLSAEEGHTDIVNALIEAKAVVNVKDKNNDTPLHLSIKGGHTDIVKVLIKAGANVNVKDKNNDTPLYLSIKGGHTDIANALIEAKAGVNVKDKNNDTPLHLSIKGGHTDIVNALIEAKADVNESNNQGLKPVLLAALYGHTEIIKMLFSGGAKLDMDDPNEMTSMFTILMETDHNVMSVVLSDSHLCNARGDFNWTILHEAASLGCPDHIKNLLRCPGINVVAKDDFARTPLHCASEIGKQEMVEDLFEADCDVFSLNSSKQSCLHIASIYGHSELVEFFIGKGLDPCKTDTNNRNCLHYAVLYRQEEVVGVLLPNTQSISSYKDCDVFGKLPVDYLNDFESVGSISKILRQKDTNIKIMPLEDAEFCIVENACCPNTSVILKQPYIGLVEAIEGHHVDKFVGYVKLVVEMVIRKAIPCKTVEIISVGSSAEGTKNGLPDEFDFIIRLYSVDSKTSEEKEGFRKMERNEAKVNELNIIGSYGIWLWDQLTKFWCTCQHIKLRTPSGSERDGYFEMQMPPQRHPDHKTCTTWVWLYTGGIFKNLPVSIDFVPAIETEVDSARTRSTWMMSRDYLARKSCFIVPKMPHESSSLGKDFNSDDVYQLGRVSFPTLEVKHLKYLDKRVLDVYSTAKCLRKPEVCGFKIRDEEGSVKPAGEFVTSYHLKTVFLHLVKVFLNTKMTLGKMVLMVYEYLERCLERGELPMFFEQEVNVLAGSRLNVKDSLVVAGMMKTFARYLYERDFPSEIESDTAEEKRILAVEQENHEKNEDTYMKYDHELALKKWNNQPPWHRRDIEQPPKPIIPLYLRQ